MAEGTGSYASICGNCGGDAILFDANTGEHVCRRCGCIVATTTIDSGPEWRAFNSAQTEERSRVGAPLSLVVYDGGLSTSLGWADRDAFGRRLKPAEKAKQYRLRKWQRRSRTSNSEERNLAHALSYMSGISYKLRLPKNVLETAAHIYRRAIKMKLLKGRTIDRMATACLYMACRKCHIGRTLVDLSSTADLPRVEVARDYRYLFNALRPDIPGLSSQSLISRYVSRLRLSGGTELLAKRMLFTARELRLTVGRGPTAMAGACLYIACILNNERLSQKELAEAAQVTEVTIRARYKEILTKVSVQIKL